MNSKIYEIYDLIKKERLEDLASDGYLLKHKKSGARVVLLSNDDENKVFSIGFRTPPLDDTGVPHIMEHSVLCGSDKYNVKDPFVELCKGSLNTFLNAMTYPDKTVYPVASCNLVDYKNICDVYLDAVFHPNIAKKQEIFKQEGWHYELFDKAEPLTVNGVVYNEMKGAFSSPDGVLERKIMSSLFPDNAYGKESGGDPKYIPKLTYEQFLDFYKKYYHPSNSYIYFYGDMDMEERLLYLDREYLSNYDILEIDSTIEEQKAFDETFDATYEYSITEDEANGSNDYLSYNVVVGKSVDKVLYRAFGILDYVLLESPGAPVKKALIDANIGEDVYSTYENGIMQPMYSIIATNTSVDKKEEFVKIIRDTLKAIVKEGIDKKALLAAINKDEFKYREADFGRYPRGLMYGLQSFDSWLYDENEPFMHIEANDTFAALKAYVDTDYYEELINTYLLENTHSSIVALKASTTLAARTEKELEDELAEYKASLSDDELERIIEETKQLKEYQDEPSTEEELKSIPMLERSDIKREYRPVKNIERTIDGIKVIFHDIFTNEICYLNQYFSADGVDWELISYVGLLKDVLGYIDTKNYSYGELSKEIDISTGGIGFETSIIQKRHNLDDVSYGISVKSKVLYQNVPKALALVEEILNNSLLSDTKRLKEIITECKSRKASIYMQAGHTLAISEAMSSFSKEAYFSRMLTGYGYYTFIEDLEARFDSIKDEIVSKLSMVANIIFNKNNLLVSLTCDEEGYRAMNSAFSSYLEKLKDEHFKPATRHFEKKELKLGLTNSAQVQYVAVAGNFIDAGYKYSGVLKMLSVILGYDYMWINIRVKGGAYGCMSGFIPNGNMYLVSYRDPKLVETLEVFNGVASYLENFDATERDMTKYVIGTMGNIDIPLSPKDEGERSMAFYLSEATLEDLANDRNSILDATKEDIKACAALIKATLTNGAVCVVGNEQKIRDNSKIFTEIKSVVTRK